MFFAQTNTDGDVDYFTTPTQVHDFKAGWMLTTTDMKASGATSADFTSTIHVMGLFGQETLGSD